MINQRELNFFKGPSGDQAPEGARRRSPRLTRGLYFLRTLVVVTGERNDPLEGAEFLQAALWRSNSRRSKKRPPFSKLEQWGFF